MMQYPTTFTSRNNIIGGAIKIEDASYYSTLFSLAPYPCVELDNLTDTDALIAYVYSKFNTDKKEDWQWSIVQIPAKTSKVAPSLLDKTATATASSFNQTALTFTGVNTSVYLIRLVASVAGLISVTNAAFTKCENKMSTTKCIISKGINTFLVTASASDTVTLTLDAADASAKASVHALTTLAIDNINRLY